MRIDIITVLPEMFPPVLQSSILGRAISSNAVEVVVHDLREWTFDRHRTTTTTLRRRAGYGHETGAGLSRT